jgi:hypothetical protein
MQLLHTMPSLWAVLAGQPVLHHGLCCAAPWAVLCCTMLHHGLCGLQKCVLFIA